MKSSAYHIVGICSIGVGLAAPGWGMRCKDLITAADLKATLGAAESQIAYRNDGSDLFDPTGARCIYEMKTDKTNDPLSINVRKVENPGEGELDLAKGRSEMEGFSTVAPAGVGADSWISYSPRAQNDFRQIKVLDRSRHYILEVDSMGPIKREGAVALAKRLEAKLAVKNKPFPAKAPPVARQGPADPKLAGIGLNISLPKDCHVLAVQEIGNQHAAGFLCLNGGGAAVIDFIATQLTAAGWSGLSKDTMQIIAQKSGNRVEVHFSGNGGSIAVGPAHE